MTCIYLRLAGPLQSWAGPRVSGNFVYTEPRPGRRAIEGLLAAALGASRGQWPAWLSEVDIQVREDNPGVAIDEFQTIDSRPEGLEFQQRIYRAITGKRWTGQAVFTPDARGGTSIVRRTYRSGAEYLVSISAGERSEELTQALLQPVYSPYLGKKAFTPSFPLMLGTGPAGLLASLPRLLPKPQKIAGPANLRLRQLVTAGDGPWEIVEVPQMHQNDWLTAVGNVLTIPKRQRAL